MYRLRFFLEEISPDEPTKIIDAHHVDITFTHDDLRAIAHVKRGRFINESVQKGFLACVHYVREHSKLLLAGGPTTILVSKDIHGDHKDVKEG